jgi:hypothetical protein
MKNLKRVYGFIGLLSGLLSPLYGESLEDKTPLQLWEMATPFDVQGGLRPIFVTIKDKGEITRRENGAIYINLKGPINLGGISSGTQLSLRTRSFSSPALTLNGDQTEQEFVAQASRVGPVEKVEHEGVIDRNTADTSFHHLSQLLKIGITLPFSPRHLEVFYKNAGIDERRATENESPLKNEGEGDPLNSQDKSFWQKLYDFFFGPSQKEIEREKEMKAQQRREELKEKERKSQEKKNQEELRQKEAQEKKIHLHKEMAQTAYEFLFGGFKDNNLVHQIIREKLDQFFQVLELKLGSGEGVKMTNFLAYLEENPGVAYRYAPMTEDLLLHLRKVKP